MAYAPARLPFTTRLVVTVIALLSTVALGGIVPAAAGAATPTVSPTVTSVTIKGFKFIPNTFTVTARTPVVVKNK